MSRFIQDQARQGFNRITSAVKRYESSQGHPVQTGYGTVSNPPITAEIEAIFDTASNVGTDFVGLIIDSGNGYEFLVWCDGSNWYVVSQANSSTFSGAKINRTTSLSIATGTPTFVDFDSEDYDTNNYHDNAVNPSRLTIPEDGYYRISACITFAINGTGSRELDILRNASTVICRNTMQASTTYSSSMSPNVEIYLDAGDYIRLRVEQDSGGNLFVTKSVTFSPYLMITKIG